MGRLSTSLTDTARVVREVIAGPRVEGMSPTAAVRYDWFACRLVPTDAPEATDPGGRRSVSERAQLVTGAGVDVLPSDGLEIRSTLMGDGTWRITGAPARLSSRRRVMALIVPVARVVEPTVDSTQ